jgi:DNA-binding MarR family transcriptional regulator/N-acetylglutamate synthase-like GNAT family acetyltransferase
LTQTIFNLEAYAMEILNSQFIEAVRSFNRFYTRKIGLLQEGLLRSPFSLTEARIIYEVAQQEKTTATQLGQALGLDAGYLSRILAGFRKRGLINKEVSGSDARQYLISLSNEGQAAFAGLDADSRNEVEAMLSHLTREEQLRLVGAMQVIQTILGARAEHRVPFILRPHQPGDMGWVVQRQGIVYNREYNWDEHFEALVAQIVAKFIENFDPKCERCWIAEKESENVGCVFLIQKSKTIAQLRLLFVEPKARGMGIGKRLVNECTRFACQVGYQRIVLWTNSVLDTARHIYEQEGYKLVEEEPHHSFGSDLVGQNWELALNKT